MLHMRKDNENEKEWEIKCQGEDDETETVEEVMERKTC